MKVASVTMSLMAVMVTTTSRVVSIMISSMVVKETMSSMAALVMTACMAIRELLAVILKAQTRLMEKRSPLAKILAWAEYSTRMPKVGRLTEMTKSRPAPAWISLMARVAATKSS